MTMRAAITRAGNVSPFEERLLAIIHDINRRTGAPARTVSIAAHLGCVPTRTVQWWLHRMEHHEKVTRLTPKTGWVLPAFAPRVAHLDQRMIYAY